MGQKNTPQFSRLRALFWPIHRSEWNKIIPMLLIFFLICFDYNILRNLKDTIVVMSSESGAAVIPFIKVYAVLPMAILSTWAYSFLAQRISREKLVYLILSCFLLFFVLFAFVFFPNRDSIHPTDLAEKLKLITPKGLHGLIALFTYWSFTIFYCICELWGTLILLVLFWGFANEITSIQEATRYYAIFGISSNISNIFGGQAGIMLTLTKYNPNLPFGSTHWEQSIALLTIATVIGGIAVMAIFWWMNRYVLPTLPKIIESKAKSKKPKQKLSFLEQIKVMSKNRYLMWIALIVLSYNVTMNLVEVVWKSQLKELYPSPADFNIYMNQLTIAIGFVSTFCGFFLSGQMIRSFGWTSSALVTPLLMLVSSAGFFFFYIFGDNLQEFTLYFLGTTPLVISVFFGATQNTLCKAAKYTFFDTTKELALIPLDSELKAQGKATIDGLGSRLGKSMGSLVHQVLLFFLATLSASAPIVGLCVLGACITWIYGALKAGKTFNTMTADLIDHRNRAPKQTQQVSTQS